MEGRDETLQHPSIKIHGGLPYLTSIGALVVGLPLSMEKFSREIISRANQWILILEWKELEMAGAPTMLLQLQSADLTIGIPTALLQLQLVNGLNPRRGTRSACLIT